ncbi:MAG TPA: arsenate reductase ArsC [Ignavibacteria bacterium]|nr:arsenate reductase ArsC [Ignavibacteria bacterium]
MKILILCTGNSCRSQMAEGFLRSFNESLEVYSAGVEPAEKVNPNSIIVMDELGIDISNLQPDNVSKYLEIPFDYVITVCDHANETCPVFTGEVKNRLHMGFEDPYLAKGSQEEILDVYREIRDQIQTQFNEFYVSRLK